MDNISSFDKVTGLIIKRETERQFDIKKKRDEKKLISAENEQYEFFSQTFQERVKTIEALIKSTETIEKHNLAFHFDKITKEIRTLQKFVSDSSLFIREYDMRICQETFQNLQLGAQKLEEKLLPKKKFGFKARNNPKKPVQLHEEITDEIDGNHKKLKFVDNFFGFRNKNHENLILSGDVLHKKDVALQNLTNCVVRLFGTPSTLQISNMVDTIIITGPVSTSVFAENCTNCKIVIACQQLRLHSSNDCDVYLHVTSRAIIEDCNKIRVAPYNLIYDEVNDDFVKAGLDRTVNNWNILDDFNWLVLDKQSPNWTILDKGNIVHDWESYAEMKHFNICIDH